jgi:voltage-gated potassium channel
MGRGRRWLRLVLMCGALLVVYFAVPAEPRIPAGDAVARAAATLLALVVLGALVTRQLRLQIDEGMDRRVDGLVVSVVGVVVAFALIFYLLDRSDPTQVVGLKTRTDSLYFTMTTLTTVGYGDVYASGQAARTLVMIQMVFNVLFVTSAATLLSGRIRAAAVERAAARGVPLPDLESRKHKGL